MKALSVRPEYTYDIFTGNQTYEERTWQTDYRGDLLICASSRKAPGFVSGYAYFVIPLLDIELSDDEVMNNSGNIVHPYHWILGKPKAIKPIPVKGKLHLYDVDDSLIEYVDGGDLEAYGRIGEIDKFIENYTEEYLVPLGFDAEKVDEYYSELEEMEEEEEEELPPLTDEELEALRQSALKDYQPILDRIALMRKWLDLGVFWESIGDSAESADLGPLPDVCGLEWEELDTLLLALENLEKDLKDNEPAKRTPAHKTWTKLLKQVGEYADTVDDFMAEVEMEAKEEAFENQDNE